MLEEFASGALFLLAIAGAGAILSRLIRTGIRLLLHVAEVAAASGLAEVSARRGDLTALAERRRHEARARRLRRNELLLFLLWVAWLVAPVAADWLPYGYAAAAPLWLLPARPLRPRQAPSDPSSPVRDLHR